MANTPKNTSISQELEDLFFHSTDFTPAQRNKNRIALLSLLNQLGPQVHGYPIWHPILSDRSFLNPPPANTVITLPNEHCAFNGLDHTIFFKKGFITCPYGDADEISEALSVSLDEVSLTAQILDMELYNSSVTPILVTYDWDTDLEQNEFIPERTALRLMLAQQFKKIDSNRVAETWETMKPFFLGYSTSTKGPLFVSRKTELRMKKMWNDLIDTGVFGEITNEPLGIWPA